MEMLVMAVSLLKLTLGCTIAGTLITIANDKAVHKLIKKVGWKMTRKKAMFEIGNEHTTVLGLTQHGKTYGIIKTLEKMKIPVLFFNTQHTPVGSGWVEADGGNTIDQIIYALKQGYKVNFLPDDSGSMEGISKQLGAITDKIFALGKLDFYFAVDEVHLFKLAKDKSGLNALIRLATTGLGRGFKMIFISQRGAMVDNTLYTQSTKHIMFALGKPDYAYLKNLGFPSEEIAEKIQGQKYVFVEFDQKDINGPFMIQ